MPEARTPAHERRAPLDALTRAAYSLSAADARLRGRATRTPGALSLTHARALRVLAEEGPLPVKRLAERAETTGAAATQLVNGLVRAGHVTRERPDNDRRSVLVTLTPAGLRRHREREQVLGRALDEALQHLDDQALRAATEVLRRLAVIYDGL
ncbi:MarR family winged helix-turn-helix transcriptional regulator [Streptomyces iranensis]|uniref:DNA-binding MarR family transcriptional regulator n=1 Tax=Streptomyces iranensis TaxID=576784 RepID=A0ABS4N947_9ACTN|nr:MarR family transcriptional regulator [Streptomyces iranensis]MBP2068550.1 DNA-binding MarR family transcriptional regulator [Streptomyces iranensis]